MFPMFYFSTEMNIQSLTELKVIPLLVQVLSLEVVSAEVKLKVILTISVITRSSGLHNSDPQGIFLSVVKWSWMWKEPVGKI